ncbi:DEKNAAC103100 [Brettanomyces naardenensis]|uniref:DEKNAAC103100 n=1 Tax=Brettanomyces naardenensis TaxID=13370 RepID=A0A448YMB5_BRENA|nr:DEKNAAC103100 [Brettanomyces naardenensis]
MFSSRIDTINLDKLPFASSSSSQQKHASKPQTITLEWNSDGTRLAYSKNDKSVRIVKFEHGRFNATQPMIIEEAHDKPVGSINWDPKLTSRFVTVARDSTVHCWDVHGHTVKLVREFQANGEHSVNFMVKYSKDGSHLAVGSIDGKITIFNTQQEFQFEELITLQLQDQLFEFDWNKASDCILCSLGRGVVEIYRLDSERPSIYLLQSLQLTASDITSLRYAKNDKLFAVGTKDSQVQVVDAQELVTVKSFENYCDQPVGTVDVFPLPKSTSSAGLKRDDPEATLDDSSVSGVLLAITYEYGSPAVVYSTDQDPVKDEPLLKIEECQRSEFLAIARFNPKNYRVIAYNDSQGDSKILYPGTNGIKNGESREPVRERRNGGKEDERRSGRDRDLNRERQRERERRRDRDGDRDRGRRSIHPYDRDVKRPRLN